jgi:AcrR family transcriptional regulator
MVAPMTPPHRFEDPPTSRAGARARENLIEAAGEVFAEKGFQGATSREICLRAGVNLAAVNYHFGGFDALYVATLKEAHRRAVWIGPLDVEGFDDMPPRERLRAVLHNMVERLAQTPANSWETRLVSQELVIPTFAQAEFVATSIEPRRAFLRSIIAEILGRSPGDAQVGRCLLTVIAPCVMMSIISRRTLDSFLPDLGSPGAGVEALVDHVVNFVLAGMEAVVEANLSEGSG